MFQVEYGSKHHKGSRRGEEERNKNSIGIFPPGSRRTAFKDKSCAGAKLPKSAIARIDHGIVVGIRALPAQFIEEWNAAVVRRQQGPVYRMLL